MLVIGGLICVGLLILVIGSMFAMVAGIGLLIAMVIGAGWVGAILGVLVLGDRGGFIVGGAIGVGLVLWAFVAWQKAEDARKAAEVAFKAAEKLRLEEEARQKREAEESRKKKEREAARAISMLGKLRKWLS